MATKVEAYKEQAAEISKVVNSLYGLVAPTLAKIDQEKEVSEKETELLTAVVEKARLYLKDALTKNNAAYVEAFVTAKIAKLNTVINNNTTLLSYTPNKDSDLLVINDTNINTKSTTISGSNRKYKNLAEDCLYYADQPTVAILGRHRAGEWSYLHNANVAGSVYSISTTFKLDRFPTRTWFSKAKDKHKTQTTRRAEIIRFTYNQVELMSSHNNAVKAIPQISIGALAPWSIYNKGRYSDDGKLQKKYTVKGYNNKFDPFSLVVWFSNFDSGESVYTDFKFKLGVWYTIKVDYDLATHSVAVYVNGVQELIGLANGNPISKNNNQRRGLYMASAPGFLYWNQDPVTKSVAVPDWRDPNNPTKIEGGKFVRPVSVDTTQYLTGWFNVDMRTAPIYNTLANIVTPPYQNASTMPAKRVLKESISDSITIFDRLDTNWDHNKHKMDTAINYGDIHVDITNSDVIAIPREVS